MLPKLAGGTESGFLIVFLMGAMGGRQARLRGRSRRACRHSRAEAARGATRLGLPSRAAPPASSPRVALVEKASQAALHVKMDSIELAGHHLIDTCGSTGKRGISG